MQSDAVCPEPPGKQSACLVSYFYFTFVVISVNSVLHKGHSMTGWKLNMKDWPFSAGGGGARPGKHLEAFLERGHTDGY